MYGRSDPRVLQPAVQALRAQLMAQVPRVLALPLLQRVTALLPERPCLTLQAREMGRLLLRMATG